MRVPRFLKVILIPLIVVTIIRFYNDAGPLQLFEVLNEFQYFKWSPSALTDVLNDFTNAVGNLESYTWQQDLSVIENLYYLIESFFAKVSSIYSFLTDTLGSFLDEVSKLLQALFRIVLRVLGFN